MNSNQILRMMFPSEETLCRGWDEGPERHIKEARTGVRAQGVLHVIRAQELHGLAAALANFGRFLPLADDTRLFEETAAAHFAQNTVALHHFVEPLQGRLERLIVVNNYTRQETHPSLVYD
jgi:hypothetical protein